MMRTISRGRAACAIAAVSLAAATGFAPEADAARGTVVQVTDGDTVVLRVAGTVRTFELRGVKAPHGGECFANAATAQLRRLLPVRARVRTSGRGRSVFVFRGGSFVNRELVRGGYAAADPTGNSASLRRIRAAERAAQAGERGRWSRCGLQAAGGPSSGVDRFEGEPGGPGAPEELPPGDLPPGEAPPEGAPPEAAPPDGGQTGTQPAHTTRMSQTQWQAYIEGWVFTRTGTDTSNAFTFCPGGRYGWRSESLSGGIRSTTNESGRWKIHTLTRRDDLRADEAKLELIVELSSSAAFTPQTPSSQRTYSLYLYSFDDGRVAVGNQVAHRSAAPSCA